MLEWTGERYVPWADDTVTGYEHLHRYRLAKEFVKGKKVLDLACGEGYGSLILSEEANEVTGIDIDETTIRHASSKYFKENLKFLKGSVTNIPIEGEKIFDVVVCFEALEHVEEHDELLKEVKRLLKANGIFIVSTPNKYIYTDQPNYQNPFHLRELYFDEFKNLLSKNFKSILLYGQKVYPSSNIFPLYQESGPSKDFPIEKGDKEFLFVSPDKKLARYFIAVASDSSLDKNLVPGNSYLLDLSETLFHEKDAHTSNLEGMLKEREAEAKKMRIGLAEREGQIGNLEEMINQKATQIFHLEGVVRERDGEVGNLKEAISQKAIQVSRLEGMVSERDGETGNLEETINQKATQVSHLEGVVREKEAEVERLRAGLAEKEREVGSFNETITQKDAQISNLEGVVRKKGAEAERLRAILAERDGEIRNLEERVSQKDGHIFSLEGVVNEKETVLKHIHSSHGWKALLTYYRVRDKIFPAGSRKRRAVKFVWSFLRTFMDKKLKDEDNKN